MRQLRPAYGRVVPALMAVGLLAAVALGRDQLFVRPWFSPALVLTAVVLAVVALRSRAAMRPVTAAVLLLPLVVGASLSPARAARSAAGAGSEDTVQARIGEGQPRLLGGDQDVTILDVVLAEREAVPWPSTGGPSPSRG